MTKEEAVEKPVPTRQCDFCKEQVRTDAIRCRYCGATLHNGTNVKQYGPEKIVYVVDRDLVRFGKFASAILGLFAVLGIYLFGIDLKKTRSDLEDAQDRLEELQSIFDSSLKELEATRADVRLKATEVGSQSKLAQDALNAILETQNKAKTVLTSLVRRRDGSVSIKSATVITDVGQSASRASDRKGDLWAVGATIRISFLGGDEEAHEKVRQWANEWTDDANVRFRFVENQDAEVRVSFDPNGGAWSFVGTQALQVGKASATMNLGWLDKFTVLHEFGHALGLLHETANPNNNILWNEDVIYEELSGPPSYWTKALIRRNFLDTYGHDHFPIDKSFDAQSIMMYEFPASYTVGEYSLGGASQLSIVDRQFIKALYPE